ncbi:MULTISPECIES: Dyp-type peroxidase [Pseudomonas]
MNHIQQGILLPIPPVGRYLLFSVANQDELASKLKAVCGLIDGNDTVMGLGQSLVLGLGARIPGLKDLPQLSAPGIEVPAMPAALWCWLRGEDRGEITLRSQAIVRTLAPALELVSAVDAFKYGKDLDLSGYEDGTENPIGNDAFRTAFVAGQGPGLDGSSFVAVQQWLHDFNVLDSLPVADMNNVMGRMKANNEELEEAPLSAHVKRTNQESFEPAAYVLRRSMPWSDERRAGLLFTAFGNSFDAFEVQLKRMLGLEDGVLDGLFRFTRPITGAYFWCPPMKEQHLDLSALGLSE